MLGVTLTAQRAGWGSTEPIFISTSTVSTAWNAGWSDYISLTSQGWTSPRNGDNLTSTFDDSGIVSGNKYIQVWTMRVQAASNYTFQTDAFRTNYQTINTGSGVEWLPWTMQLYNSTVQIFNRGMPARHITNNNFSVLLGWGCYDYAETAVIWDSLADQWITIMYAASDDSADFAGYSATTPPGSATLIYNRITITDAVTGSLITSVDYTARQINTIFTDFVNYTWAWNNESTSISAGNARAHGQATCNLAGAGDINLLTAAGWAAAGETIDPLATDANGLAWREYFVGQNFPETVDGVQAWCNWSAESATVDGADLDVARMLGGRASTTDDLLWILPTSSLDTPYTSTDRPGN